MRIVRVQYTVTPDYVEQNKQNIEAVMAELRALDRADVKYATYLLEDGRTFMHFAQYQSIDGGAFPTSLETFKHFQAQLKEHLQVPPQTEHLTLVQSSFDIF